MYNNKLHIEIFILVFMFTVSSLCVLFSCYYISPNNYILYDFDPNLKSMSSKEYTINSHKQKKLKYSKCENVKLGIFSNDVEHISVVIENRFKSDNICVDKGKLLKVLNSNLIIKNTTSQSIKVQVETYS